MNPHPFMQAPDLNVVDEQGDQDGGLETLLKVGLFPILESIARSLAETTHNNNSLLAGSTS